MHYGSITERKKALSPIKRCSYQYSNELFGFLFRSEFEAILGLVGTAHALASNAFTVLVCSRVCEPEPEPVHLQRK